MFKTDKDVQICFTYSHAYKMSLQLTRNVVFVYLCLGRYLYIRFLYATFMFKRIVYIFKLVTIIYYRRYVVLYEFNLNFNTIVDARVHQTLLVEDKLSLVLSP